MRVVSSLIGVCRDGGRTALRVRRLLLLLLAPPLPVGGRLVVVVPFLVVVVIVVCGWAGKKTLLERGGCDDVGA